MKIPQMARRAAKDEGIRFIFDAELYRVADAVTVAVLKEGVADLDRMINNADSFVETNGLMTARLHFAALLAQCVPPQPADGACRHEPGEHGPAGCYDQFAFSQGLPPRIVPPVVAHRDSRGEPFFSVCRCGHWKADHDPVTGQCLAGCVPENHRFEHYEFLQELRGSVASKGKK